MNKIKCTVDMANGLPCHWCVNYHYTSELIFIVDYRTLGLSIHYWWYWSKHAPYWTNDVQ